MTELTLTVKHIKHGNFDVQITDDETVESLCVVIFSMQPELGEELRLIHKGKILEDHQVLRDAGMKSGDSIAVARKPSTSVTLPAGAVPAQAASVTLPAAPAAAEPVVPDIVAEATTREPANAPEPAVAEAPAAAEPTPAPVFEPPPRASSAEGTAAASAAEAPAEDAQDLFSLTAEQQPDIEAEKEGEEEESEISSADLLAMALRLETGEVPPTELAKLLRKSAKRMEGLQETVGNLQGAIGELGQAMQMVNILSARTLQSLGVAAMVPSDASSSPLSGAQRGEPKEESRSFLHKKGDADVQEMHRRVAAGSNSPASSKIWGTSQSTSDAPTPKSQEEMKKAREERLARLEAQQEEKKKQMADANEKSKSREAMFEKPFTAVTKPLGKF